MRYDAVSFLVFCVFCPVFGQVIAPIKAEKGPAENLIELKKQLKGIRTNEPMVKKWVRKNSRVLLSILPVAGGKARATFRVDKNAPGLSLFCKQEMVLQQDHGVKLDAAHLSFGFKSVAPAGKYRPKLSLTTQMDTKGVSVHQSLDLNVGGQVFSHELRWDDRNQVLKGQFSTHQKWGTHHLSGRLTYSSHQPGLNLGRARLTLSSGRKQRFIMDVSGSLSGAAGKIGASYATRIGSLGLKARLSVGF